MSTLHRYVCLLLLIIFACCSGSDPEFSNIPERKRKQIESAVINRFHAMVKYAEAGELENILMHFDMDGPGSYVDGPVRYNSLEEMMVHYRATWKVGKQDYGIPVTKMHVISTRHVLLTSTSTLNTTTRDGVVFQPRPWAVSILWTFKDGDWYIHSFHQFEGEAKPVQQEEGEKK